MIGSSGGLSGNESDLISGDPDVFGVVSRFFRRSRFRKQFRKQKHIAVYLWLLASTGEEMWHLPKIGENSKSVGQGIQAVCCTSFWWSMLSCSFIPILESSPSRLAPRISEQNRCDEAAWDMHGSIVAGCAVTSHIFSLPAFTWLCQWSLRRGFWSVELQLRQVQLKRNKKRK